MERVFERTRLAPTPSGFLHLGNIYSFGITLGLARRHGARVLLRIDDLDSERKETKYVQDIFDALDFLGIRWDEGPADAETFDRAFSQVTRLQLYQAALERLRAGGLVYACRCSRSEILKKDPAGIYRGACRQKGISLDEPEVSWRLDTTKVIDLHVKTLAGEVVKNLPGRMHDFVVRRKDGLPAYQLASLVDDVHFGTDLIVRGEDLWDSTLAQLYLAAVLGFEKFSEAAFHHHPLLLGAGGKKLSKSAGDTSVAQLMRSGKTAAEVWTLAGIRPDW
jgi:glutamyl/glutaminyl-tRNA synthetase